ncbi:MAG: Kelch repeat-containing protein [Planctomycetota bacterium]
MFLTGLGCGACPAQARWRKTLSLGVRADTALAFDPIRNRVVLFGGRWALPSFARTFIGMDDTWEYDGRSWKRRRPLSSPPPRYGHAMAFDPVGKRILLYGGFSGAMQALSDTWAWDGRTWTQLFPRANPGPLWRHGMATDPARQRITLFGGSTLNASVSKPGVKNETWDWDGTTWIRRFPKTVPLARWKHGMAWFPSGKKIVMFGGMANLIQSVPAETWEWDGTDWRYHPPGGSSEEVPHPIRVFWPAIATDPLSGGILLWNNHERQYTWLWDGRRWQQRLPAAFPDFFAGSLMSAFGNGVLLLISHQLPKNAGLVSESWTWKGKTWEKSPMREIVPKASPSAVAYDAGRDRLLMLTLALSQKRVDTWVITDTGFTKLSPQTSPPWNKIDNQMVYHQGLDRIVLVGTETWLWDGRNWSKHASSLPIGSTRKWMAYDSHRRKIVAYAGGLRQTWEWDDKGWVQRLPKTSPQARSDYAMAYDPGRRRTVLFGGHGDRLLLDQTWEWDGTDWVEAKPLARPAARVGHNMAYIPAMGGILLFGGIDSNNLYLNDTWSFDGKTWTKLSIPAIPASLFFLSWYAAHDVGRQRVVLPLVQQGGLLEFRVDSLSSSQPYPRPGESLMLRARLPGQGGKPFLLALSRSTRPGIPLRRIPGLGVELLPLSPDPLFAMSLGLVTLLDTGGNASLPIRIPSDSSLRGFDFHAAGLTLGSGLAVGAITNAVGIEVVK